MATYTQDARPIALETPLGKDILLLAGFSGSEEISRLYSLELDLVSERDDIAPADIVGKNVTFFLTLIDGSTRYFNGYVRRFSCKGKDDRLSHYSAEMVPWLWFLTRTTNCRIFQNKSVPKIIEEVFAALGFSDFETSEIQGSHPDREYCVQYRESDFDFVSRLMEEEGIFYYFRQENGKHTLVMADHKGAYPDCPESSVDFGSNVNARVWTDMLTSWEHRYEYRSGRCAQTDYNFKTPTAPMLADSPTIVNLDNVTKFERFDYPGKHDKKDAGQALAKLRMEEEEMGFNVVYAAGHCRTFFAGGRFTINTHHTPGEEGKSYVITSIQHSMEDAAAYTMGGEGALSGYSNTFTCIPDTATFRPERRTPRPVVQGTQTAVVVGPAGEEIYTDEFGRVKVHFHWDRYGKADENASCWIRVSHPWAGKQWGAMFIPRVGQEVVVDFEEGDPDRPLIIGRLYHAESMPPQSLPDNKTQSGIKSLSSPGGGGFNELRFEDKKGEEFIFVHAEKDEHTRVKNDSLEWVGNDRHLIVIKNQHEQVDGDKHLTIAGDQNEKVDGTVSLETGSDLQQKVGMNHALEAGQEIHLKAGMKLILEAGVQLTLKVGGNFIDLSPAGVAIKGTMVMINSGGSAGSGAGCTPDAAQKPQEAMESEPGEVNEPPEPEPVEPETFSPAAVVLQQAAEDGTPFCEECERARQAALAQEA
jgi:type VI secretion system secreted protein VgrG